MTAIPDTRHDISVAITHKMLAIESAMVPLRSKMATTPDGQDDGLDLELLMLEAEHDLFTSAWNVLNTLELWVQP